MSGNLQTILTIAIPIYSLVVIILGVWLGHWLTMKAFAHVQPSVKEMSRMTKQGSVHTEPDWFDESQIETPPEITDKMREEFKKTGLPEDLLDTYRKEGRDPNDFMGYDVEFPQGSVEEELANNYGLKDVEEDTDRENAL